VKVEMKLSMERLLRALRLRARRMADEAEARRMDDRAGVAAAVVRRRGEGRT
jgi:hypothetical protein